MYMDHIHRFMLSLSDADNGANTCTIPDLDLLKLLKP